MDRIVAKLLDLERGVSKPAAANVWHQLVCLAAHNPHFRV